MSAKNMRKKPDKSSKQINITWEGSQFVYHSLALVNRECVLALVNYKDLNISLIPYEKDQFGVSADPGRYNEIDKRLNKKIDLCDFHIRHQWPPDFNRPKEGRWIIMQPWEYGILPEDWIDPMKNRVDEIWVNSKHEWKTFTDSGIPEEKLTLVPLGINSDIFNKNAEPYTVNTKKSFKFLFVGGTIWRKGIDVLLNAYKKAFSKKDDVSLIIKDIGTDSFYKGMSAGSQIKDFKKQSGNPEIVYITETLTEKEITGLYTASDCLVHPYRAEGFGLPVLEAMACGLPVIVTEGGSCDDFCNAENSYLIPAERIGVNLSDIKMAKTGWALEPDENELPKTMRFVYNNREAAVSQGKTASEYVTANWNWKNTSEIIVNRLKKLSQEKRNSYQLEKTDYSGLKIINKLIDEANEFFKNRNFTGAIPVYEKILKLAPGNSTAEMQMGLSLFHVNRIDEAEKIFLCILEKEPENSEVCNNLGCLYFQQQRFDDAEKYLTMAVDSDNSNLNAKRNLISAYLALQKYDSIVSVSEEILEENPNDVETMFVLGNSCYKMKEYQIAAQLYKRILLIDPDNHDAAANLNTVSKLIE